MDDWKSVLAFLCGIALCVGVGGHCIREVNNQTVDNDIRIKMAEEGQYKEALNRGSD